MNMNITTFIEKMSNFSASSEGVTRLPFTSASQQAFEYIKTVMESIGLKVYADKYGTLQGHLQCRSNKSIILASHYDSVPCGGKYDGVGGIATALAVADYFISHSLIPKFSIDILALNDEEGVRFNQGFLSSKAIVEDLDISNIYDKDTRESLENLLALQYYGTDTITLSTTLKDAFGYIETHIEQGDVLERNLASIGLVNGIVGIKRYYVTILGTSGHAGTIPMDHRADALVRACKIINDLNELVSHYDNAVLTVGSLTVSPNVINVIPNKVVFSIDLRTSNQSDLEKLDRELYRICNYEEFPQSRLSKNTDIYPISLQNAQTKELEFILESNNMRYMSIQSGAGHDAQIFAPYLLASMLFVPSHLGLSHCPQEFTKSSYFLKLRVFYMNF